MYYRSGTKLDMDENQAKPKADQEKRVLSFRAPKIVRKQIAELVERWGESTTHAIHRAIAIAHEKEFGKKRS